MKKILLLAAAAILAAGTLQAATKTADQVRIYINPGHGGWGPNDRPMATIPYPLTKDTGRPDTLGFYESNTNLWKCLKLGATLEKMGVQHKNIKYSRTHNGPYPYSSTSTDAKKFDRSLSEICAEVNANNMDMFISIHSNAATDGTTTNYPLFEYRGTDGKSGEKVAGSYNMCSTCWGPHYMSELDPQSSYSKTKKNVRGDISFYGSNSTVGYLAVLKHNVPGFLLEGFFHTYQPARHRALNKDYCGQEGVRLARGVCDYWKLNPETTGYIMGTVKDKDATMNNSLYKYKTGTDDQYYPVNGAIVTLKDASGNVVKTYTVDHNYNGIFVFEGLAPGTYTAQIACDGYATLNTDAITVTANATTYPQFYLMKDGSNLEASTYQIKRDTATYDEVDGIKFSNLWMRSVKSDYANYTTDLDLASTKDYPNSTRRSLAVKDGIIYLTGRQNNVSTSVAYLHKYDAATGAHLGDLTLGSDVTNKGSYTYPCNDVMVDDGGNLIVSNLTSNITSAKSGALWLHVVNPSTGAVTAKAALTATSSNGLTAGNRRIDHCVVKGDVSTGNYTVWASFSTFPTSDGKSQNKATQIVRWTIASNKISETKVVTLKSFPDTAKSIGYNSRLEPIGDGTYVLVKGGYISPTIYNFNTGALVKTLSGTTADVYRDATTKAVNVDSIGHNGVTTFTIGGKNYLLYSYSGNNNPTGFQWSVAQDASSSSDYSDLKKLYTFPAQGLGGKRNTWDADCYTMPGASDNQRLLYVFSPSNGLAAYVISCADETNEPTTPEADKWVFIQSKKAIAGIPAGSTVKRSIVSGNKTYMLVQEATTYTPHIYVIDNKTATITKELSTTGIKTTPTTSTDTTFRALNDIALTTDGVLVAVNRTTSNGSASGTGAGTCRIYKWASDDADPTSWFTTTSSCSFSKCIMGASLAVTGTATTGKVIILGENIYGTYGAMRYLVNNISNGKVSSTLIGEKDIAGSAQFTVGKIGYFPRLTVSPLASNNLIIDGSSTLPYAFNLVTTSLTNSTITEKFTDTSVGNAAYGISFVTYDNTTIMVTPYMSSSNVAGVKLFDVTKNSTKSKGLSGATLIATENTDITPVSCSQMSTGAKVDGDTLTIFLYLDGTQYVFVNLIHPTLTGEVKNYSYDEMEGDVKGTLPIDLATVHYLTPRALPYNMNLTLTDLEGNARVNAQPIGPMTYTSFDVPFSTMFSSSLIGTSGGDAMTDQVYITPFESPTVTASEPGHRFVTKNKVSAYSAVVSVDPPELPTGYTVYKYRIWREYPDASGVNTSTSLADAETITWKGGSNDYSQLANTYPGSIEVLDIYDEDDADRTVTYRVRAYITKPATTASSSARRKVATDPETSYRYWITESSATISYQQGVVTGVDDVEAVKAVESVTYVNLAGQSSTKPWQGVNVKLTRFTDGSIETRKVMK